MKNAPIRPKLPQQIQTHRPQWVLSRPDGTEASYRSPPRDTTEGKQDTAGQTAEKNQDGNSI